ncbi:hypothetical protein [Streptosporangium subroseum]|nr:hypothetical protein OHB15_26975 [Streptosporangium subroseum]
MRRLAFDERNCEILSVHITDLIRTRDALDGLMATNRAHREKLRVPLAG